ncbi:MAG: HNH endonuclease signature motif containing protein [Cloacibacillus sp.]
MAKRNRDYKHEYETYHAKPEQRKNRSTRNKARRKLGLKVGDPREVDHKTPLSIGGSNDKSNLQAISREANRKKWAHKK